MTEVVSVPMGRESAWQCSCSSPSRITNTSEQDGSRTEICIANIRAVHIDPAELELGMTGSREEGQMFWCFEQGSAEGMPL